MTKIVNPFSYRLGVLNGWRSKFITGQKVRNADYKSKLKADVLLREYLTKKLRGQMVSNIEMERSQGVWRIRIFTSRPGNILGKSGEGVQNLKKDVDTFLRRNKLSTTEQPKIDIVEVSNPETSAQIVGLMVAEALEKRVPFRRVLKSTIEKVSQNKDVLGVKIYIGGRLGGADMARGEYLKKGNIPLQTIRANVDYARERANMTYGVLGIKVWIYKGEVFNKKVDNKNNSKQEFN
jgi:small subunit ribosomal protein S3